MGQFGANWAERFTQAHDIMKRQREAAVLPTLTSEEGARADRFLSELTEKTHTQRWLEREIACSQAIQAQQAATSTQPTVVEKPKGRQVEVHIDRQPIHRIRRLEQEEWREAEQEHGRLLVERYGNSNGSSHHAAGGIPDWRVRARQRR